MSESIRDAVHAAVLDVAKQHNAALASVADAQALGADLGFDSLDLAQVAAELEIRLGVDPFAQQATSRIVTVGDLLAVYEKAKS